MPPQSSKSPQGPRRFRRGPEAIAVSEETIRTAGAALAQRHITLAERDAHRQFRVRFVAANEETRARGLMHQEPLEGDECAFFVFPRGGRYGFWNHNVSFPLTLAFCDESGRIVDVGDMAAGQLESLLPSSDAVRFVAECPRGALTREAIGGVLEFTENTLRYRPPTRTG